MKKYLAGFLTGIVWICVSAPSVHAVAIYEATASVEFTLQNVVDASGNTVSDGWTVWTESEVFWEEVDTFGAASAAITSVTPSPVDWGIGDSIFASTGVSGSASNGDAFSFVVATLDILVDNDSGQPLTFTFGYEALTDLEVSGPADSDGGAYAYLDFVDDAGLLDVVVETEVDLFFGPLSARDRESGSFSFTLEGGEYNDIYAEIEAEGGVCCGTVPEPSILALLSLGLIGVGCLRARQALAGPTPG